MQEIAGILTSLPIPSPLHLITTTINVPVSPKAMIPSPSQEYRVQYRHHQTPQEGGHPSLHPYSAGHPGEYSTSPSLLLSPIHNTSPSLLVLFHLQVTASSLHLTRTSTEEAVLSTVLLLHEWFLGSQESRYETSYIHGSNTDLSSRGLELFK